MSFCSNCVTKFTWLFKVAEYKIDLANKLQPLGLLGLRVWLAIIFWKSGVLKLPSGFLGVGEGSWDTTIFLFTEEHPVPFLSPEIAAFLGTGFEILCPILLVFGLGTRFAAAVLLIMSAFIEFSYQHAPDHIVWILMSFTLITFGGGKLTLDYLIHKASRKCNEYQKLVLK